MWLWSYQWRVSDSVRVFVGVCCRSCASQTNELCTDSARNLTRNKLDITMQQSVLAKFSYTAPIVNGCSIQESHFVDQCQKSDKQTYMQDQATSWSLNNICVASPLAMYARLMHRRQCLCGHTAALWSGTIHTTVSLQLSFTSLMSAYA